ncbi:PaaI family thioesterase [Ornithinimicrobium cryptoxanthini]|uniref:Hotdog fold thioesterase n=1 Tax=Ornithinimicrobium cryptoxanthini TaxID=2934161 RepID=A0ABY4YFA4_9MICO|nr:hotdog fold thioesterase [Ornithinimicrobium cryptoxanthini]USQ74945.1 hotdog fold thioesterase [Ornithinimicrobium cryptoxanthini]
MTDTGLPDLTTGTLLERMEIEITQASSERTVGRMPVAGNTQPYGLLHGGASAVLAESLGSIASAHHAGAERIAVGIDLNITHHRAAREGYVTGVATPLSLGRSVAAYEIVISDESGQRIASARLTCQLRDRPPGS